MDKTTQSRRGVIATLAVVVLLVAAIGLSSAVCAKGSMVTFDPDTLQGYRQEEWLVPIVDVPIYRGSRQPQSYELVDVLIARGYWKPAPESKNRRLFMYRWNEQWRDGHTTLFAALNINTKRWLDLTNEKPDIAAELWPEVLSAIRRTPSDDVTAIGLMFVAQEAWTAEEFRELAEQRGLLPVK